MKKFTKLVLAMFLMIMITAGQCFSQWNSAGVLSSVGIAPRIFVVDSNIVWVAGGISSAPKVWRTVNGGINWTVLNTVGLPYFLDCIYAKDSLTAFVADAGSAGGGGNARLFRTTNGGATWQAMDSTGGVSGWFSGIAFSKSNANFGFAISDPPTGPGYPFFFTKTTNGGQTWSHDLLPAVPTSFFTCFDGTFCIDSLFYGFMITTDSYDSTLVYFTSNGGTNWVVSGPPTAIGTDFGGFCDFKSDKTTAIFINAGHLPKIAKTTNGGVTWSIVNTSINGTGHSIVKWIPGTNVVFVTAASAPSSGNVFRSDDNGLTWSAQTTSGVQNIRDAGYFTNGTFIYGFAVTGNNTILKTRQTVIPIGIQPISSEIPDEFRLGQNYPNPFNPITKIQFSIPVQASNVRLVIYDDLGKEIASVMNEALIPGNYEIEWNAVNNSSGVYYYRLTTDSFTESKKMVLIK